MHDFAFYASMKDNFFSSHIQEKTIMHGLWLRNILTIFVKTLYFFSSYFAVSWVTVYKYWSKQSNFQISQKQSIFQKSYILVIFMSCSPCFLVKHHQIWKILIFERGTQSTIFGHFHLLYSPCFLTKNHQICNDPKITFGPKTTLIKGNKSWILVIFILFSRAL